MLENIWDQIEALELSTASHSSPRKEFVRPTLEQLESELRNMQREYSRGNVPPHEDADAMMVSVQRRIRQLKQLHRL